MFCYVHVTESCSIHIRMDHHAFLGLHLELICLFVRMKCPSAEGIDVFYADTKRKSALRSKMNDEEYFNLYFTEVHNLEGTLLVPMIFIIFIFRLYKSYILNLLPVYYCKADTNSGALMECDCLSVKISDLHHA